MCFAQSEPFIKDLSRKTSFFSRSGKYIINQDTKFKGLRTVLPYGR